MGVIETSHVRFSSRADISISFTMASPQSPSPQPSAVLCYQSDTDGSGDETSNQMPPGVWLDPQLRRPTPLANHMRGNCCGVGDGGGWERGRGVGGIHNQNRTTLFMFSNSSPLHGDVLLNPKLLAHKHPLPPSP